MKRKSRHVVIMSLCYWILHRPLDLAVLVLHSEEAKEVEIVVLRHQLHVLNRQVKGQSSSRTSAHCLPPPAASCQKGLALLLVRPETVLGWHRALLRGVTNSPSGVRPLTTK